MIAKESSGNASASGNEKENEKENAKLEKENASAIGNATGSIGAIETGTVNATGKESCETEIEYLTESANGREKENVSANATETGTANGNVIEIERGKETERAAQLSLPGQESHREARADHHHHHHHQALQEHREEAAQIWAEVEEARQAQEAPEEDQVQAAHPPAVLVQVDLEV